MFPDITPIDDYDFQIKSPSGNPLKSKLPEPWLGLRDIERRVLRKLAAHQVLTEKANLRDLFDFTEPGTYTIVARRKLKFTRGTNSVDECEIVSNELKLTFAAASK